MTHPLTNASTGTSTACHICSRRDTDACTAGMSIHDIVDVALPDGDRDDQTIVVIELRPPACFAGPALAVTGDFTAWVPVTMDRHPGRSFRLGVVARSGSRLRYRFVADEGRPMLDEPGLSTIERHTTCEAAQSALLT